MAQVCTVCKNSNTREIEKHILSGRSIMSIAKEYGLSESSLHYHKNNHLSKRMVKVYQTKEALADFNMMDEFSELIEKIKTQIERLERKESEGLTIAATNTLIKLYGVMAQFASVYYQSQSKDRELDFEEMAQSEAEEYQNSLSILTLAELKLYQMLVDKITTQDKDIDVISKINSISAYLPYNVFEVMPNTNGTDRIQTSPRFKRTIFSKKNTEDKILADLQVKEVKSSLIECHK